jgi:hypothetical protein
MDTHIANGLLRVFLFAVATNRISVRARDGSWVSCKARERVNELGSSVANIRHLRSKSCIVAGYESSAAAKDKAKPFLCED